MGEISESASHAARELRVVFGRVRRRLKDVDDTNELTPSQASVLSRLDKAGDATASELAAAERVRPQSVAATLSVLEGRGLVRRRPDPADGRRQVISLSAAGRHLVEGSRAAREEWLARAMQDRYTETERRALIKAMALLDRLTR
jgi:DNA-binding MarR family transcriptional regulator